LHDNGNIRIWRPFPPKHVKTRTERCLKRERRDNHFHFCAGSVFAPGLPQNIVGPMPVFHYLALGFEAVHKRRQASVDLIYYGEIRANAPNKIGLRRVFQSRPSRLI
jgi:hypothetical protein